VTGAPRVTCAHCRATIEVTTDGILRLAQALGDAGVRVAAKPMTMAEIEADIAERQRVAATRRRHAIVATVIGMVVVLVGAALFIFATS
jgi:hypothetical protein